MERNEIYAICLGIIAVLILIGAYSSWSFRNVAPENEWPNNITLIIEIVVGIVVALIVFMIAKTNEVKIDEKITSVLDIVKEREEIRKEKERFVQKNYTKRLNRWSATYHKYYLVLQNTNMHQINHQNKNARNRLLRTTNKFISLLKKN